MTLLFISRGIVGGREAKRSFIVIFDHFREIDKIVKMCYIYMLKFYTSIKILEQASIIYNRVTFVKLGIFSLH